MSESLKSIVTDLRKEFSGLFETAKSFRGETTLELKDATRIKDVCLFCKESLGFDYLVDLSGVDNYGDDPRFEVVYELFGYRHHQYLRLRVRVSEENPLVPSVVSVWRTANWHEREAFDMYGVSFEGHPNHKRILMWDGYPYFPLRKDFPLAGKDSEVPGVAFSNPAPLEGGPFVTVPSEEASTEREPRSRTFD